MEKRRKGKKLLALTILCFESEPYIDGRLACCGCSVGLDFRFIARAYVCRLDIGYTLVLL